MPKIQRYSSGGLTPDICTPVDINQSTSVAMEIAGAEYLLGADARSIDDSPDTLYTGWDEWNEDI